MSFLPPNNLFWILADALELMVLLIIAGVLVSWGVALRKISPYKPWVRTIGKITDPFLDPFRRLAPPHRLGGLDISPILAIVVIEILQRLLFQMGAGG